MTNWSQYSPSVQDDDRSGSVIRYQMRKAGASVASPIRGGGDDPESGNFLPLDRRKEIDKARFWALHRLGHFQRQKAGVFDA